MGKIIHRWRKWLDWNDYAKEKYNWVKRFLIFLGIIHNDWFENFVNWNKAAITNEATSKVIHDGVAKWENGTEIRFDD